MFHSDDYTEEQAMIDGFVSQLSKDYDHHYFLKHCRDDTFPDTFWNTLVENGFLGFTAPEALGGSDFGPADLVVFLSAIAQAGMTSNALLNQLLCCDLLSRHGSDEQKKAHVPELIKGARWSYSAAAGATGRHLNDVGLTAKQDGDAWVLNGTHTYVAGVDEAHRLIVAARTGKNDVGLFILDPNAKGVEAEKLETGVRVAEEAEFRALTGDVFFNLTCTDARVAAADALGTTGGTVILHDATARQLLMNAASGIGWGERVLAQTVTYANERVIYEEPISSYQAVQHPMVRAKTELELAKMMVERAVAEFAGKESDLGTQLEVAAVAKYVALEAAYKACDIALQAHGGSGYDRDTGIITIWPLMLMARIMPLNGDVIMAQFADAAFGGIQ